jgi:hypothetical protein
MKHAQHIAGHFGGQLLGRVLLIAGLVATIGCASQPTTQPKPILEAGRNVVNLEPDTDSTTNSHPAKLTPSEAGTLLRGVRAWERRNFLHRLYAGEATRSRAFLDDEIALLAPALSKALAHAAPSERVYFHLSHATDTGEEETTTGWASVRGPLLHLSLSEVHDRHGPAPDIGKYDRQMPNVPEASAAFDVIFEPEEHLAKVTSAGRVFSSDQREELQIRYREALAAMPIQPGLEQDENKPATRLQP